jgi:hypothetical protein
MAKALLGHIGGVDPQLVAEMRRLRRRVYDLESQVGRLQEENDSLSATARLADIRADDAHPGLGLRREREPALA